MAYSQCGHFDGERLARMRDAADAMKRAEDQLRGRRQALEEKIRRAKAGKLLNKKEEK